MDGFEYMALVATGEYHSYIVACKRFEFQQSLSACPTWRYGIFKLLSGCVARSDGNRHELGIGICGMGIVSGGALGAQARRRGGILLIGACDNLAVVEQYGRSDMELAVGSI